MTEPVSLVSYRKRKCLVCRQQPDVIQDVNAAMWDGKHPAVENRTAGYRASAIAILAANNVEAGYKAVTGHAHHVEVSARAANLHQPVRAVEMEVYATDFEGVSTRLARLGMMAADKLERMIEIEHEDFEVKDLVATASLGLRSVQGARISAQRDEALRVKKAQVATADPALMAIFVFGAGMQPELSDHTRINVTPLTEMRDALAKERAAAEILARGTPRET